MTPEMKKLMMWAEHAARWEPVGREAAKRALDHIEVRDGKKRILVSLKNWRNEEKAQA